ncbi:MAG: hypothetical protein LBL34_03175 [Clostridiales bacterium]|jgi:hypothetical protein|nr:hypothetical protein [Clostridiales bacterium]
MFKKLHKGIASIGKTALMIMQTGMQVACGIALIAVFYEYYAQTLVDGQIAVSIMKTALILFGESIIFGLAFSRVSAK